ncbi:MAG: DUF262 domain-containing protein [Methanosarcinales archaeon]|nr:DUF262 domain-containing protein [Methanosarcinales archaeon]
MAQKIESDKLLVRDIFSKWFRIPEYQRPYVWGEDQVIELLDDVMQARTSNPDSQYFLGSMVLSKKRLSDYPLNSPQIHPPFHESHDFSKNDPIFSPKNPYYPIIFLNIPEFSSFSTRF